MADLKITQLPELLNSGLTANDIFPVVDQVAGATKKIKIFELDLRYAGVAGGGALTAYGSALVPVAVDAAVGLVLQPAGRQLRFVKSQGGEQVISAIPQIPLGGFVGQEIIVRGCSDVDYIVFQDGNGLSLNGSIKMKLNSSLWLFFDGATWVEISRR